MSDSVEFLRVRLDQRETAAKAAVDRRVTRVMYTVEYPRPWWRRLLRLPPVRVRRGPYEVQPWPKEWDDDPPVSTS